MNKLSLDKQTQIINLLCEGNSLRATSRLTGCSINTVTKLLVSVGKACMAFHDEKVVKVKSRRIQCDEIWSFCYAKQLNVKDGMPDGSGDVWTWTGIDADTKLIVSWMVGNRDADSAYTFMQDLAARLANRVQLTTDGLRVYLDAVYLAFVGDVDYAQLIKIYGVDKSYLRDAERKYSPAECLGTKTGDKYGTPDPKHISTSFVERQNLTMRMHMRRFTRLTNGFSKKIENHVYALALYFVYYNFHRIHKTLRVTPAMEANLTDNIMSIEQIVMLADEPPTNRLIR